MSEVLIEAPKITIGFERKVNLGDYESAAASIFIQVPTSPEQSAEERMLAANLAFADAKSTVYDQLGIQTDVIEGVVVEKLRQQLGAAIEVESRPTQGPNTKATPAPSGDVPESQADRVADLLANPKGWYDNRVGKKNPKGPDFKRKGAPAAGEEWPPSLWLKDLTEQGAEAPEPSAFK